jgi:hypothetical protein
MAVRSSEMFIHIYFSTTCHNPKDRNMENIFFSKSVVEESWSIEPAVFWDVVSCRVIWQMITNILEDYRPVKQPVTLKCKTRNESWNSGIATDSVGRCRKMRAE